MNKELILSLCRSKAAQPKIINAVGKVDINQWQLFNAPPHDFNDCYVSDSSRTRDEWVDDLFPTTSRTFGALSISCLPSSAPPIELMLPGSSPRSPTKARVISGRMAVLLALGYPSEWFAATLCLSILDCRSLGHHCRSRYSPNDPKRARRRQQAHAAFAKQGLYPKW